MKRIPCSLDLVATASTLFQSVSETCPGYLTGFIITAHFDYSHRNETKFRMLKGDRCMNRIIPIIL